MRALLHLVAKTRHRVAREAAAFLVFGAANTVITLVLYQVFLLWMAPQWAYTLMFACGIALSALLYSRFVFRAKLQWQTLAAYTLFYIASYAAGLGLLMLFIHVLKVGDRVAIFLVIAITTPANFLGSRLTLQRAAPGLY